MSRVALVTGGTRGIGEAICVGLKERGYKVAANYVGNEERATAFTEKNAAGNVSSMRALVSMNLATSGRCLP